MALLLIGLCALIILALYRFIFQPAVLSPLAKIPIAHWSAAVSPLWILNERRMRRETRTVHAAHVKHGPIIRLAPNEISVNSVDGGIRTVYTGGYEKGDWYPNIFNNYGFEPMFSMRESKAHSKRKRMLSNIYAKSTLQASPSIALNAKVLLSDRLIPALRARAEARETVEIYTVFSAITLDAVTSYVFGLSRGSNFVEDPDMGNAFFENYKARQHFQFWPQEMASITRFLTRTGLRWLVIPRWVDKANRSLENWLMEKCEASEKLIQENTRSRQDSQLDDWPTVYAQLRRALILDVGKTGSHDLAGKGGEASETGVVRMNKENIASELLDHVLAGFDTSSITLTFLAWELSRPENNSWQVRLREELSKVSDLRDSKALDELPVLHAIVMESLRLHAAIPGNQPRVTPANATLGAPGHVVTDIPANVRVQAQAWSLHREPGVFPNPESWDPSRWLEASSEHAKEMARWFWAFGSGGRMCVGSNLAMLNMKAIIAAIWSEFRSEVVDDKGMVHAGTYVAEPIGKDGKFCVLKLESLGPR